MLMLEVPEEGVKGFMNKLLKEEIFDGFECRTAVINNFARFEITGAPAKSRAEEETTEKPAYCLWKTIRPHVFNIIRGNEKPKTMKVVLAMVGSEMEASFPEASALFLNIFFDEGKITITGGAAEKTFSLQKNLDSAWGEYIENMLKENGIIS